MDEADRYIDLVTGLPPAPTVATGLLGLFGDPNRDIDQVVELIGYDPSLTVEVLRRCNSAAFVGSEPVVDMFEAVTRLGFYEVYCVVVGLVGARTMSLGKGNLILDVGDLWRHSVTTAVASSLLARRSDVSDGVAFTAGLLHDVGKLVLISLESPRYGELVRRLGFCGQGLAEAELSVFGTRHATIGSRLLTRWGLPDSVTAAVRNHHELPDPADPFAQLAAIVGVANVVAHHMDRKVTPEDLLAAQPEAAVWLNPNSEVER